MSALRCEDPSERRAKAREQHFNGIDYVEVDDGKPQVIATFLCQAPDAIVPANVRIEGGRPVRVVDVSVSRYADPTRDDAVRITLDRRGDASTYTLTLVGLDDFDPRYASAVFSFAGPCRDELDCAPVDDCPPAMYPEPVLSYLAKDYASFRALILDRLALVRPDWTERHVPDLGVTLVELLAYAGDQLSYFQDAVATEAYLDTARRRVSLRRHLRLIDHRLHEGCNARAWVVLHTDADRPLELGRCRFLSGDGEVFEPLADATVALRSAHNEIEFWTWNERLCSLAAGATAATLKRVPGVELCPGDVLVFEEVLGPRTGSPADADPAHRQAVRLTSVAPGHDPVAGQDVVEIGWAGEDALRFELCLSRVDLDCRLQTKISVARGNVVLADHGRRAAETVEIEAGALPEIDCDPCAPQSPRRALQRLAGERRRLSEAERALVIGIVGEREANLAGVHGDQPWIGLTRLLALRAPFPVPYSAPLTGRPLTHAVAFPPQLDVAAEQARLLEAIAPATRAWLDDLWRRNEALAKDELAALRRLFGRPALEDAGLAREDPAEGLGRLRHRWSRLLARRLRRLESLIRRSRSGYVLGDAVVAELATVWGADRVAGLSPGSPVLAGPASRALRQDAAAALAQLQLHGSGGTWTVEPDLLDSDATDRHVVVELDDDGRASLRFGDGDCGRAVDAGVTLHARYRLGNGRAGNVGAEVIKRIAVDGEADPGIVVRNPLPASGGTDPESAIDARLLAPAAIRHRRLRAVTADDYAALAGEVPGVQRAAAVLAWNGSWHEADIAIDPLGATELTPELRRRVTEHLFRYRRIGHDLHIDPAAYVPIVLDLFVCVEPRHPRGDVRRAVLGEIRKHFHPDQLSFGGVVAASAIVARVQALAGVQHVSLRRLERLGQGDRGELASGVLRTLPLEVPRLDGDPDRPQNGRLILELGGGR
jgi:predicted phage baseplate assembly protein